MKIVAMVPLFNDVDIIAEVLNHIISEGVEPVVLDNGSTDGSYEICQEFFKNGQIELHRFETKDQQTIETLRKLYDMALVKSPDWIIKNDSDEFLESEKKDLTLKEAITKIDSEGYNLIQFDVFNFFITGKDDSSIKSVKERMKYYSFNYDFTYRAWKYHPGILPEIIAGHLPIFPADQKYRIWPKKFALRHYSFRNKEQAEKKIKDRLSRNNSTIETKLDWHIHYAKIQKQDFSKPLDHRVLNKYREDKNWNLERKFSFTDTMKTKEEIFLEDGFLKNPPPSYSKLKLNNINMREKLEKKNNIIKDLRESKQNSFIWRVLTKIDKFRNNFAGKKSNKL